MRILHLTNTLVDRGNGIINVAVDLAIEQSLAGHQVAFVAGDGGYGPLLAQYGVGHYGISAASRAAKPWALLQAHRLALGEFQPDLVHAHMRAGLLAAWPLVKRPRTPIIGHVHNVQEWQSRLFRLADATIAVSQSVSSSMQRIGIKRNRLHVVLNGPLGSRRLCDSRETVDLHRPAVVTVAGMNHRKGIAELIDAFTIVSRSVPQASLYLVGDGPDRGEFEARAARSPASRRIFFTGFRLDPRPYMRAADVFVLASRRESLGLVLLEAREAGCAIIASEVDGISEALDGGRAGLLIPPRNPELLAQALVSLLRDDGRRRTLAQAGRHGLGEFTTSRMASKVEMVYQAVLDQRHRTI